MKGFNPVSCQCVKQTRWSIVSISRFAFPKHEIETIAEVALLHADIALPVGGDNIFS